MWREYLAELIGEDEAGQFQEEYMPRPGVSGAHVLLVRRRDTGVRYAIKYGVTPRHPLEDQVVNQKMIMPLFGERHFPVMYVSGPKMIVMEAVGTQSLHDAVVEGSQNLPFLKEIYGKILNRFAQVWETSARLYQPTVKMTRDPVARAERIRQRIESSVFDARSLGSVVSRPVVVNGQKLPSLGELLLKMLDTYTPPKKLVTCHGDPNASNFMINDRGYWWLVDFEWVGIHDWRVLAGQFAGWWISNATHLRTQPSIRIDGNITIDYATETPQSVDALIQRSRELAEETGEQFGENQSSDWTHWRHQVDLQTALFLLGEMRFLEARGRSNRAIPLLGEGLKIIAGIPNKS